MSADELTPVQRAVSYLRSLDIDGRLWITGVAINGPLAGDGDESAERAKHFVDIAVATQNDAGQSSYGPSYLIEVFSHGCECEASWELTVKKCMNMNNSTAIGHSVLDFYDRMGKDHYLGAAERVYESFLSFERTEDGGIPYHDPELAGIKSLWIDSVYMVCPFLVRHGAAVGDTDVFDEAVEQILIHAIHLRDGHTGLFRHIWVEQPNHYLQGAFWARSNGRVVAVSADMLERFPEDHPKRDDLLDLFRSHCEALLPPQDGSGFWHNLADDPHTPLESSGTFMFTYTLARGIDLGILDAETYHRSVKDGPAAVSRAAGEEGAVNRVAGPPGSSEAPLTDTPYGQGWFLMAAVALGWDLCPQRSLRLFRPGTIVMRSGTH